MKRIDVPEPTHREGRDGVGNLFARCKALGEDAKAGENTHQQRIFTGNEVRVPPWKVEGTGKQRAATSL